MATPAQREHLRTLMVYLYNRRSQIHYPPHDLRTGVDLATFRMSESQVTRLLDSGGTIQSDCSEMVTELCRWVGLHDPNGLNYRYPGYTGTMLAHLPHYTEPKAAGVGALCVVGPGTGEHVYMVLEPGPDPLFFSHGEPGIDHVRWSQETRRPRTFLSIAHL